jgi:hypothetical protein
MTFIDLRGEKMVVKLNGKTFTFPHELVDQVDGLMNEMAFNGLLRFESYVKPLYGLLEELHALTEEHESDPVAAELHVALHIVIRGIQGISHGALEDALVEARKLLRRAE